MSTNENKAVESKEIVKDNLFSELEEKVMASSVFNTEITADFYKKPFLEANLEDYYQYGEANFGPLFDYADQDMKIFINNIKNKLSTLNEEERLSLIFHLKHYFSKDIPEESPFFS